MTKTRDQALVQPDRRQVSGKIFAEAARRPLDKTPHRKPTGPVTYTIEKGANVWPWRSKS
jgi:hypothetical protein